MSIWDDHDYGLDDAGGDWPLKKNSERLFEYIWIPKNDERRSKMHLLLQDSRTERC